MQLIPVKTRILQPPQDDLFSVLKLALPSLLDGDIVLVSSKVMAIHEGLTEPITGTDKDQLVKESADLIIPRPYWASSLTVAHHTFLGAAGIDESNGNGYFIKLPKDVFASAKKLRTWLMAEYKLTKLGVIVTDSHSSPFRFGATGVSLGWWGIEPIEDCRGRADLFGRKIEYERSNLVDGLAAAATVLMGEVDECTPAVIARAVPRIVFTEADTRDQLFVKFKDDTFRVLYERFIP